MVSLVVVQQLKQQLEVDAFAHVLKDACASLFGWDREMLEGKTEESRVQREQVD